MSLYQAALTVHVLAAVFGMGPFFVAPLLSRAIQHPGSDARIHLGFLKRVNLFPSIGGPLLLISGFTMAAMNRYLSQMYWLKVAIALFVLVMVLGAALVGPTIRRLEQLLPQIDGETGQVRFLILARRLFRLHVIQAVSILAIVMLMVLKPF